MAVVLIGLSRPQLAKLSLNTFLITHIIAVYIQRGKMKD